MNFIINQNEKRNIPLKYFYKTLKQYARYVLIIRLTDIKILHSDKDGYYNPGSGIFCEMLFQK